MLQQVSNGVGKIRFADGTDQSSGSIHLSTRAEKLLNSAHTHCACAFRGSCLTAKMAEAEESCSGLNVREFNDYLKRKGFSNDVLESFLLNEISGNIFLLMEEDELKELIPITGYRIKIKQLLKYQKSIQVQ